MLSSYAMTKRIVFILWNMLVEKVRKLGLNFVVEGKKGSTEVSKTSEMPTY